MKTNEKLAVEIVLAGDIFIAEDGRIMRVGRRRPDGTLRLYPEPRRIDVIGKDSYCRVMLTRRGRSFIVYAHRLVWIAANGQIPDGQEINHINNNRADNRLANLELKTHSQNAKYAADKFGAWSGERSHVSPLTADEVLEIRRLDGQCTRKEIAAKFNVSVQTVGRIITRKTWAKV
jgi:hypothetical protein